MGLVIKKKVTLGFLGEEYKDAYLNFRSIPLSEYRPIQTRIDKQESNVDTALEILEIVKDYFIDGEFPIDGKLTKLTKDDLADLNEESITECFQYISGQKTDPKS